MLSKQQIKEMMGGGRGLQDEVLHDELSCEGIDGGHCALVAMGTVGYGVVMWL